MMQGSRTRPRTIMKPVHKAEYGTDCRQYKGADNDKGSTGFHLSSIRLWLHHQGALAMKVGPPPRVIRTKQLGHRPNGNNLAVGQCGDAIADGVQAGEIVRDHEDRQPERVM